LRCWWLGLLFTACVPSTSVRLTHPDVDSAGRAVVEAAVQAHGGLARLQAVRTVQMHYREWWSWPFSALRQSPWASNPVEGTLILDVRGGGTTFVLDGRAYVHDGRRVTPAASWNAEFALPRTHYLVLLPFKFLDKGAHHRLLGRRTVRGRPHDEVLIWFDAGVGASPKDRYWALFDAETHVLHQVSLTVSSYHPLAFGDVVYEDHVRVGGLLMATTIRAFYPFPGGRLPLHVSHLDGLRLVH